MQLEQGPLLGLPGSYDLRKTSVNHTSPIGKISYSVGSQLIQYRVYKPKSLNRLFCRAASASISAIVAGVSAGPGLRSAEC